MSLNILQILQWFACYSVRLVPKIPMRNKCIDRWYTHRLLDQRDATKKSTILWLNIRLKLHTCLVDWDIPRVSLRRLNCWPPPKYSANKISHTSKLPGMCRSWRKSHCICNTHNKGGIISLTQIDDRLKSISIPLFLPHLFECIGQFMVGNFFGVLKFQKPIATVPGQIDQNVTARIGE